MKLALTRKTAQKIMAAGAQAQGPGSAAMLHRAAAAATFTTGATETRPQPPRSVSCPLLLSRGTERATLTDRSFPCWQPSYTNPN